MKNLIALFSEKRNKVSLSSFASELLTQNELLTVRGGGESYPIQEMPIIIPPGQGRSSN